MSPLNYNSQVSQLCLGDLVSPLTSGSSEFSSHKESPLQTPNSGFSFFPYFFIFTFSRASDTQTFPAQGSNPHHSSDLHHTSANARSFACCAPENVLTRVSRHATFTAFWFPTNFRLCERRARRWREKASHHLLAADNDLGLYLLLGQKTSDIFGREPLMREEI